MRGEQVVPRTSNGRFLHLFLGCSNRLKAIEQMHLLHMHAAVRREDIRAKAAVALTPLSVRRQLPEVSWSSPAPLQPPSRLRRLTARRFHACEGCAAKPTGDRLGARSGNSIILNTTAIN